jgi:hypothetical protein
MTQVSSSLTDPPGSVKVMSNVVPGSPMAFLSVPSTVRLLVAVAGVVLLSGRAAAGCGDYVAIGGRVEAGPPAPMPKPCHGPECSSRPTPSLPSTAPATAPTEHHDWATPAADAADPDPRSGWAVPHTSASRGVRLPRAIFHPPRAG